jgi:hypothetical protein
MIITNTKEPFECGEKRFYMPGITIEEECPNCEKPMVIDYKRDYLMYPMFNESIKIHFCCNVENCGGGATRTVVLRLEVKETV